MSFDLSRKQFNPLDDYFGVVMQQGRVQLDADWNTMIAQFSRRIQAESLDTFGPAVVPMETPDAFLISGPSTAIEIGPGRIYVDGLLAENHTKILKWDARLAEISGTAKLSGADIDAAPTGLAGTTAYDAQPYYPKPPALPVGETYLVYVEVWQRDITYLQDASLVDVAVGVDTTARQQTVWQVKSLDGVGDIDPTTDDAEIPGWLETIHPSSARLSTDTGDLTDDDNPCLLPPQAGYKGLENQLYRVQIHNGGTLGSATFKWSRDNAVVSSRVSAISGGNEIVVDSLGRDDVLSFNEGDWVEITDDHRDLMGLPGEIRRIQLGGGINTATRSITLEGSALPIGSGDGEFPVDGSDQTDPARNTRIIRWDQAGIVFREDETEYTDLDAAASIGAIEIPATGTRLFLEKGILVDFDLESVVDEADFDPEFKAGDYWIFSARVNDASIELLDRVPPMGVHHHYAKLAIVTDDDDPIDCREHWPPDFGAACCTVKVEPGESIQAAIDSLPEEGGCICIKTGLHEIHQPLRIENSNIVIHGESAGARIRRNNGVSIILIRSPSGEQLRDVAVLGVRLETPGAVNDKDFIPHVIVFTDRCTNLRLHDCVLAPDRFNFVVGVRFGGVIGGSIERCEIGPVGIGVWAETESTRLAILDNRLNASFFDGVDGGSVGIWLEDAFGASRVERNEIRKFLTGVVVNSDRTGEMPSSGAHGTRIVGNRIQRDSVAGGTVTLKHLFGIEFAASAGLIRDNTLNYASAAYGGIRVTGRDVCIEKNRLNSGYAMDPTEREQLPIAIQLGYFGENLTGLGEGGVIRGNHFNGRQDAIFVVGANRVKVVCNRLHGADTPTRFGVLVDNADNIVVADNEFQQTEFAIGLNECADCTVSGNLADGGRLGVLANDQTNLSLHGNRIKNQSSGGLFLASLSGTTHIIENRVVSCGFKGFGALNAFGILVLRAGGKVHIESCKVLDTGVSADQTEVVQPAIGITGLYLRECLVLGNEVRYTNPVLALRDEKAQDRALWLLGSLEWRLSDRIRIGWPAQVIDNTFSGPGFSHLVEFQELPVTDAIFLRFDRVTFSNNHCMHWSSRLTDDSNKAAATVSLRGHRAIVMGNHVKATSFMPSFHFNGMRGIYMGNVADGSVEGFADFPSPAANFNL